MKINRLIEIILILLNRKTITANELSQHFNVSIRTIYRDIDILSTCGIPIYTTQGFKGGISLLDEYTISKSYLTDEERDNVIFSLKTLQATNYPNMDGTLEKLSSILKVDATDWVSIDFVPWGMEPNNSNKLTDIKDAILHSCIVTFSYINANNLKSERSIEPIQLQFKGHAWYIWGWDIDKEDFRMYKISRIRNFVKTEFNFDKMIKHVAKTKTVEAQKVRMIIDLELEFQEEALYRLYDDFDEEIIVHNVDGTYTLNISFPEDDWLYGYLLSFGERVKVMKPQHIQDIIKKRIDIMTSVYE